MSSFRAPWLGSWKAPWGLGCGRRWGDPAWALAAIAQAWMLGGKDGRWPCGTWEARWPQGPSLKRQPDSELDQPPREWVSLLRHGSPGVPPDSRGRRETDLVCACWQALLAGDGAPWMHLGTALFNRQTRAEWVPVLCAVGPSGDLLLPPFLDSLVPPWMKLLPEGWWEYLLSRMDHSGTLIPEGPPPRDLPWTLLDPEHPQLLEPLVLEKPPSGLSAGDRKRWIIHLSEDAWMVDPRLRAWGRGKGIVPSTLASLVPPSPSLGDPLPEGDASLCSTSAHSEACSPPCADPSHWLGEGLKAASAGDHPKALRAFQWSHAHFVRLKMAPWARRAAAEAAKAALRHGDLPSAASWRRIRGALEPPQAELEEAELLAARGERNQAVILLRKLVEDHPQWGEAQALLTREAILADQLEDLQTQHHGWHDVLESLRHPERDIDPDRQDAGLVLLRAFRRARRDPAEITGFWKAWEDCPDQPLRLETGLLMLESAPLGRTPERLLAIKILVDRNASDLQATRLRQLWPAAEPQPSAETVLQEWLGQRRQPTWLTWGSPSRPTVLGHGPSPPPGMTAAMHGMGSLSPLSGGDGGWWGFPLFWEGIPVGSVLTKIDAREPLTLPAGVQVIAPWLHRMAPPVSSPPGPWDESALLTDGSDPMASVLAELTRVAPSLLPVLILGPTGSGKELAAREIHLRSGRKGPFIPINCSEYVETLMESELFGHTKGAFTGADRDRKGAIEHADGGTLFLDEVADLPPRLQSLLLRVLQEKEIRRVGGDKIHKVNVRFLAATHRPLDRLVVTGHFRKDLHYRLKGVVLTLPSLAERSHEFPYLIPRLVARVAKEAGLQNPELSPGLARALALHPWPGNVRELRHAIERALLCCTDSLLKPTHFPELVATHDHECRWEEATRRFQRGFLLDTLKRHRFHITEAAQCLGITRPALYLAAKRIGLDLPAERNLWEMSEAAVTRS